MSELKFNLKDSAGKDCFFSPTVKIVSKSAKVDKTITGNLALQFGYVVKAMVERSYTDKTKVQAGALIVEALADASKKADDVTISVYMPKLDVDRDNSDLGKWQNVITVSVKELLPVADALNKVASIYAQAESIISGITVKSYDVTQPTYYTAPEGQPVAKKGSGKTKLTSLF